MREPMLTDGALTAVFAAVFSLLPGAAFAGRASDLVESIPEPNRLTAFQSIISNAYNCTGASKMIFMGESEEAGYWTVRCSEADYMVEVKNAGELETKVLQCSLAEALGLRCWRPF